MRSKYGAKKVVLDGITFDSKKEAKRYSELKLLERAGKIRDLRLQVKFQLIPAQYDKVWDEKKHCYKKGKCIERECNYVADFTYYDESGAFVVEDTKSVITRKNPVYIIKRKLLLHVHGKRIREI